MAKDGSPEVQSLTRPGIEPGTFLLVVRDLTSCANLAQTVSFEASLSPGARPADDQKIAHVCRRFYITTRFTVNALTSPYLTSGPPERGEGGGDVREEGLLQSWRVDYF